MRLVGDDADIGETSAPSSIAPESAPARDAGFAGVAWDAATAAEGYGDERCFRATPRIVTDVPIARAVRRGRAADDGKPASRPAGAVAGASSEAASANAALVSGRGARPARVSVYEGRLGGGRLRGRAVYCAGLACSIVVALLVIWLGAGL
jgi:hypothetical protein